jgi:hypothetical protein
MDVLKVFNLIVCANNGHDASAGWFFNLIFAPIAILFPFSRYSILALISITLFTLLIYTSDSSIFKMFNSDGKGNKNIFYSLLTGFLIYTGTSQGAYQVGTYTIIPSGLNSSNYDITFINGTLNIYTNTFLIKANEAIDVVQTIILDNQPVRYIDKIEIFNLLNAAARNGEDKQIREQHIRNIQYIIKQH